MTASESERFEDRQMSIKLMKLYNGDLIMGEMLGDECKTSTKHCIVNPRLVMMMPTMAGSMTIALKPVCFPFACSRLKEKLTVEKSQIMFTLDESEIDSELINGYKSEVSGIKIASAAEAASIASASKASSPKEFII